MQIGPLKVKLQLLCGDGIAMGPGKADLLVALDRHRSISAAGRALGMSYRRTWLLVDEMNRCFNEKLVETLSGGGRERGARVTSFGLHVLSAFRDLEAHVAGMEGSAAFTTLSGLLLEKPRPSGAS